MGKKFYKKLLALGISVSLSVTALAGCGTKGAEETAKTGETETATEVQEVADTEKDTDTEPVIEQMTFPLPDGPEEAEIYVEPVEGISDDFIRGMDASAVLSVENSGATYYNYDGEEQDVFMTLAQSGVNYIRLRVWNDPYDVDGNGYGGGNNDSMA